jgi:hypothetical protein
VATERARSPCGYALFVTEPTKLRWENRALLIKWSTFRAVKGVSGRIVTYARIQTVF